MFDNTCSNRRVQYQRSQGFPTWYLGASCTFSKYVSIVTINLIPKITKHRLHVCLVSGHSSCLFIIYAEQQQHPRPLPLTANRILYIINVGEYDFSYKVNSGNRVRCVSVELCYQFSGILFFRKMAGQFKL